MDGGNGNSVLAPSWGAGRGSAAYSCLRFLAATTAPRTFSVQQGRESCTFIEQVGGGLEVEHVVLDGKAMPGAEDAARGLGARGQERLFDIIV